jgi:hypothetical protein
MSRFPGEQVAVPGQQRGRTEDSMGPQPAGEQAAQGGYDRSVWPTQARPGHLRRQHRDFVTQDEDLDILGGAAGEQSKSAEQPERDQIQQSEQHDR